MNLNIRANQDTFIKEKNKSFKCMILLLFVLLLINGCSKKDIFLRTAYPIMPISYDPADRSFYGRTLQRNIYEFLLDENNSLLLAERITIFDLFTAEITIKKDIYFSDGSPLAVDDVVRAINRHNAHVLSDTYRYPNIIDSLVVVDDYTFMMYKNPLYSIIDFRSLFRFLPIYKFDPETNILDDYLSVFPLGTGPFKLNEFSSEKIVLEKNNFYRYYKKNNKTPDFVEIYYVSDIDTQYEMFKADELDFILNIPISSYDEVFNNDDFTIIEENSNNILLMHLNLRERINNSNDFIINPLSDIRVRKALVHAINLREFVENTLLSKVNIITIPSVYRMAGYPFHLEWYEYDPELSRRLLIEAGYSDGFEMIISVLPGKYSLAMIDLIKENLNEINIRVFPVLDHFNMRNIFFETTNISASMLGAGTLQWSSTESAILQLFFDATRNQNHLYNQAESYNQLRALCDDITRLHEFDSTIHSKREELANIIYDQVYVIPFFEPFNINILNKKFSFDYSYYYKYSAFKVKKI